MAPATTPQEEQIACFLLRSARVAVPESIPDLSKGAQVPGRSIVEYGYAEAAGALRAAAPHSSELRAEILDSLHLTPVKSLDIRCASGRREFLACNFAWKKSVLAVPVLCKLLNVR